MKYCRERALILLEVAKRTDNAEYKAKVVALAEVWSMLAAMIDALAMRANKKLQARFDHLPN